MTKEQFFATGFGERKVIMCTQVLELVHSKHRSLVGIVRSASARNRPNQTLPAALSASVQVWLSYYYSVISCQHTCTTHLQGDVVSVLIADIQMLGCMCWNAWKLWYTLRFTCNLKVAEASLVYHTRYMINTVSIIQLTALVYKSQLTQTVHCIMSIVLYTKINSVINWRLYIGWTKLTTPATIKVH